MQVTHLLYDDGLKKNTKTPWGHRSQCHLPGRTARFQVFAYTQYSAAQGRPSMKQYQCNHIIVIIIIIIIIILTILLIIVIIIIIIIIILSSSSSSSSLSRLSHSYRHFSMSFRRNIYLIILQCKHEDV